MGIDFTAYAGIGTLFPVPSLRQLWEKHESLEEQPLETGDPSWTFLTLGDTASGNTFHGALALRRTLLSSSRDTLEVVTATGSSLWATAGVITPEEESSFQAYLTFFEAPLTLKPDFFFGISIS